MAATVITSHKRMLSNIAFLEMLPTPDASSSNRRVASANEAADRIGSDADRAGDIFKTPL